MIDSETNVTKVLNKSEVTPVVPLVGVTSLTRVVDPVTGRNDSQSREKMMSGEHTQDRAEPPRSKRCYMGNNDVDSRHSQSVDFVKVCDPRTDQVEVTHLSRD